MNVKSLFMLATVAGTTAFTSCGTVGGSSTSSSTSTGSSILGAVAGSLLSGGNSSSTSSSSSSLLSSALNSGSLISGVIGTLTNSNKSNSIEGTWTYSEPTVQFESENLLAQAGGAVAGQAIVNKLTPYYTKMGLKSGTMSFTFNSDNTCTYTLKGKQYSGTYKYDKSKHTLVITGSLGLFSFPTAYVTASSSTLAMTFDSSKVLSIATALGASSSNSTVSSLSSLAKSYDGMKMGFLFKKN